MKADAVIDWEDASHEDGRVHMARTLYAYLHTKTQKFLYFGRATYSTPHRRWNAKDKQDGVWAHLKQMGISHHQFIVGRIAVHRLTDQLIEDIESLFILSLKPSANVQGVRSRGYCRPGYVVQNIGSAWPGPEFIVDGMTG